jgi:O-antigen/teichoic acid export membrane protein
MSKQNKLIKDMARVLSANLVVAIVGFLGSFVFPKILTIESYALYHTFTLYVGYIAVTHLGFPSGMMIYYAGQKYDEIDTRQYKAELTILFTILGIFTAIFLGIAAVAQSRMILYVGAIIFPVGIISSYKSLLQSWGRFKFFSRMSSFQAASIPIAALAYYIITGDLPGDVYIIIYIIFNWLIALYIMREMLQKVHGVKRAAIKSAKNWETEKTGAAVMIGNYINVLFTSADKQFVSWFFSTAQFAYYSFGMSMQSLMTVFITSIAQPLFPAMARGQFKDEEYDQLKEVLMIFGSFSGCAYFVASFIVKHFIQKYIPSLDVVGVYFVVFPVMAVINCLFINLYKIRNLMREYIITLAVILGVAIGLNALFVFVYPAYYGVAIATVITYYIWYFVGMKQFPFMHVRVPDLMFLGIYTVGFFLITRISNDIIGFFVSLLFVVALTFVFFRRDFNFIMRLIKRKA